MDTVLLGKFINVSLEILFSEATAFAPVGVAVVAHFLFVFVFFDKILEFEMFSKVCTFRISFQPAEKNGH